MANLIVTILAIALVAVMALAGLWYGSSGYNNSQAKARGAALISQAEQLGAGVRLWSTNNAGSVEAFGGLSGSASCVEVNDTTASSLISNGFLSTMPTVTSDVKDMGGSFDKNWIFTNEATTLDTFDCTQGASANNRRYLIIFLEGDSGRRTCEDLINLTRGYGTAIPTVTTVADFSGISNYSCGLRDGTTDHVFAFRLF